VKAIWHDLECGRYTEDLPVWHGLAERSGGPVLDVGAGTGRTALELARAGYSVTAIDLDDELLEQLRERAQGLDVTTVVADARSFWLGERFGLCIMPMQTIQLLGGAQQRAGFLECAREHLESWGALALALTDELELFDVSDGAVGPLPDVQELDGAVYSSQPIAVRADGDGFVLERRRETVTTDGQLTTERDLIRLDRLDADTLEHEAVAAGLRPAGRVPVPPTPDYVGSTVVVLRA
jgi:SAM-dependent methyltransferase